MDYILHINALSSESRKADGGLWHETPHIAFHWIASITLHLHYIILQCTILGNALLYITLRHKAERRWMWQTLIAIQLLQYSKHCIKAQCITLQSRNTLHYIELHALHYDPMHYITIQCIAEEEGRRQTETLIAIFYKELHYTNALHTFKCITLHYSALHYNPVHCRGGGEAADIDFDCNIL